MVPENPEISQDPVQTLVQSVVLTPTSAAGREIAADASEDSTPVSPTPAKVRKTAITAFSHLKLRRFKACNFCP